ncbi:hypothetical protein CRUP_019977, partial [Coryphaenoides rupestris]
MRGGSSSHPNPPARQATLMNECECAEGREGTRRERAYRLRPDMEHGSLIDRPILTRVNGMARQNSRGLTEPRQWHLGSDVGRGAGTPGHQDSHSARGHQGDAWSCWQHRQQEEEEEEEEEDDEEEQRIGDSEARSPVEIPPSKPPPPPPLLPSKGARSERKGGENGGGRTASLAIVESISPHLRLETPKTGRDRPTWMRPFFPDPRMMVMMVMVMMMVMMMMIVCSAPPRSVPCPPRSPVTEQNPASVGDRSANHSFLLPRDEGDEGDVARERRGEEGSLHQHHYLPPPPPPDLYSTYHPLTSNTTTTNTTAQPCVMPHCPLPDKAPAANTVDIASSRGEGKEEGRKEEGKEGRKGGSMRQNSDQGTQYRSVIYTSSPSQQEKALRSKVAYQE